MSNTPFTDANLVYGGYVRKSAPMVPRTKVAELEHDRNELALKERHARDDIQKAHEHLDAMGVPRLQPSGMPYSLAGRMSVMRHNTHRLSYIY